jgi:hypothetical protein
MNSHDSTPKKRSLWPRIVIAAVVVAILISVVAIIRSRRLPSMTREAFNVAKSRWNTNQPADYDITVQVKGMQPGLYRVSVENGLATSASFDGRDLTRPRTFGTWAVIGMFDTLSRDLDMNDQHGQLMLGAEFDPDLGIPLRYERIEMRTGAHDALQWEVTEFESHQ